MQHAHAAPKEDGSAAVASAGDRPNLEDGAVHEYDELHVACPPHTTRKRLAAKVDLHIIPFLSLLYLVAFLDRINIANARSFGLAQDLGLGGVEYNSALVLLSPGTDGLAGVC